MRFAMRAAGKLTTDYLLVDVSNSFVKLAFSTTEEDCEAVAPSDLPAKRGRNAPDPAWTQGREPSWSPPLFRRKNKAIVAAAGSAEVIFLNSKLDLGVGIDYPQPQSIGADRLANAAAVAHLYGAPAIVVDFGTAVTFDVVSAAGDYVGGVIAPGLEAMTNYLYQRTALAAETDSAGAASRDWQDHSRRDDVRRCFWLSRLGA